MTKSTTSSDLIERLRESRGRSARDIAATVHRLIISGDLAPGTRLPTVRAIAVVLGVSAATVSEAWGLLRRGGLLDSRRRNGTFVRGPVPLSLGVLDLSRPAPDSRLLPSIVAALTSGAHELEHADHGGVSPVLVRAVEPELPFPAEAWLVADGLAAAIRCGVRAFAGPGETIAVAAPLAPHLLDALRGSGAHLVQVECDGDGPRLEGLRRVLERKPKALVLPTSTYLACGHSCTAQRAQELAAELAGTGVGVLEVDELGPLSPRTPSLGRWLPERVLLARSYDGAFGPSLRVCVVVGGAAPVDRIRSRFAADPIGPSPILQNAVAHLIVDPVARQAVDLAREHYDHRREALGRALVGRALTTDHRAGLGVWVRVSDSAAVKAALDRRGVVVIPDDRCYPESSPGTHIGMVAGCLPDDHRTADAVADLVAAANARR
ncbi:GntR family transcriptional regulator [Saccharothrix sp. HUAS TT1]|uniref:GntR family transcriptional regulator n=1 Tax=unclassified Saccharothrix TaxID=2593673 RepID=UPI00345B88B0